MLYLVALMAKAALSVKIHALNLIGAIVRVQLERLPLISLLQTTIQHYHPFQRASKANYVCHFPFTPSYQLIRSSENSTPVEARIIESLSVNRDFSPFGHESFGVAV